VFKRLHLPAALALVFLFLGLSGTSTATLPAPGDALRYTGARPVGGEAVRQAPSVTWCGDGPLPSNRSPELELSSLFQVHVVYAIPADGTDQFGAYASRIASDTAAIDAWWQAQDATRTLRFDLYPFPGCTSRFGMLDIGFARLPHEGAYYLGTAPERFERLIADLPSFASLSTQKILVYYDGPVPDPQLCGVSNVDPGRGGPYGFAFVWLQSGCPNDVGQGKFSAAVAAHELVHGLGALSGGGAPHVCTSPEEAGHVCDSTTDILYPYASESTSLEVQVLDFGRDDYYGHPGTWFDAQDSPWLARLPQSSLSITVKRVDKAAGSVTMTLPAQLACSASCTATLDNGTAVALTAVPQDGSRFDGWGGACSGTGACSVKMDAARSVSATFTPGSFAVSVTVRGRGRVSSAPGGIACSIGRCLSRFPAGRTVRLRAEPSAGFRFASWSGDCRGRVACVLRLDRDRSVRATFVRVKAKTKR